MPKGCKKRSHHEILSYEEILRICKLAISLGIVNFKVTGGEPFVRKGVVEFIARLKALEGVESVTLTTNGSLLVASLPELQRIGINGINVSLDALKREKYRAITGADYEKQVLDAITESAKMGIRTKINTVMLEENVDQYLGIARLAKDLPIGVRFIEVMPIGTGNHMPGPTIFDLLQMLKTEYPDLYPLEEKQGNGPAKYYTSRSLQGMIGVIGANTQGYCGQCNRIRLTSTGELKPCLCYENAFDLRESLRNGSTEEGITHRIQQAIGKKPASHCFTDRSAITETRQMCEIGG